MPTLNYGEKMEKEDKRKMLEAAFEIVGGHMRFHDSEIVSYEKLIRDNLKDIVNGVKTSGWGSTQLLNLVYTYRKAIKTHKEEYDLWRDVYNMLNHEWEKLEEE